MVGMLMSETYPNYDPTWPMQVFGQLYQDQGMKKWGGFYLSDHTAVLNQAATQQAAIAARKLKPQMRTVDLITQCRIAIEKQLPVSLQPDLITFNSSGERVIPALVSGQITSYNARELRIANTIFPWEVIRWLAIITPADLPH